MISGRDSKLPIITDIFDLVKHDSQIFQLYTPEVKFNTLISSPLREDRKPSFIIRYLESHAYWHDYSTGESGGALSYVKALFPELSHDEILTKVHNDILMNGQVGEIQPAPVSIVSRKCDLKIKSREFTEGDLRYWNSFGITERTLKLFKVKAISHYWLNGRRTTCNFPAYAYNINGEYKVYLPTQADFRFISGTHNIQGYDLLPNTGEVLLIQKSFKDVMLTYEYGIPSVAPQSESIKMSDEVIADLKTRFKNIFVMYDKDRAGIRGSELLCSQLNAKALFLENAKDLTDHCKEFGKVVTGKLLHELISNGKQ